MQNRTKAVAALVATMAATSIAASPAVAAAGRSTTTVTVAKNGAVSMSSTLRPGLVRLHNASADDVAVYGKRKADVTTLVRDLNAAADSEAPGKLVNDFTVVDELGPHTDAYLPLAAGTYYVLDDDVDTYKASLVRTVTVRGAKLDATAPAKPANVTVAKDGSLHAPASLARSGWVHFANNGGKVNGILIVKIGASVSAKTIQAFLAKPSMSKVSSLDPAEIGTLGVLSNARSLYTTFVGKPARYMLLTLGFTAKTTTPTLYKGGVHESIVH